MNTITYTDARNQLTRLIDEAVKDREPITITRNGTGVVVLLAMDEYQAMEETLHLLSTPANAERVRQGLTDYSNKKWKAAALCN
ncbi:MAG: type II toxin-antitoxin system Phd/YefM family antitoxin [Chthoniobacterales bacterium]